MSFNNWCNALVLPVSSCLVATVLLGNLPAKAQVSLSPLIIEQSAERGQSQSVITINNTSDQPFRARVYAEPFTYSRDDGFQVLETTPSSLSIMNMWIKTLEADTGIFGAKLPIHRFLQSIALHTPSLSFTL